MLIRHADHMDDGAPVAIRFPLEELREALLELWTRDPFAPGVRQALFVVEQGQRWRATYDDGPGDGPRMFHVRRDGFAGFCNYNFGDFAREFLRVEGLPDAVREVVRQAYLGDSGGGEVFYPYPSVHNAPRHDPQLLAPMSAPKPRVEVRA
jgi:hypothetical protein